MGLRTSEMGDETTFLERQAAKLPVLWKLRVIRCSIYAIVVGADAFDTGVEGFDSFAMMTPLQRGKLAMHILVAMLTVWVAFLDQTMGQKPDEKKTQ